MTIDEKIQYALARAQGAKLFAQDSKETARWKKTVEELRADSIGNYTVHDILNAEINLEPLICLACGSHEVTFHQYIGDAYCANCGKWQLEIKGE